MGEFQVLSAEAVKERARKQTGLDDFGAPGFEEGLSRTLDAFARVPLLPEARQAAETKLVADLANRLRIEAHLHAHPEIMDTPVEGPVLVFGLPRTGTTATVAMMALDPRFRFLRAWEASAPLPPPRLTDEASDPRALAARKAAASYGDQAIHLYDPDGPEEDLAMLAGLDMRAYHGALPMPDDFINWWIDADFASLYAFHRKVLQLLHSQRPPHLWLLKAPPHLFKLEAFAAEYPDAKFIMTHRDPAKVIASDASLRFRLHSARCDPATLDKRTYGPKLLHFWREGMDRALKARERIGEHRFIDVYNTDVASQPVETFAAIYEQLGFSMDADLRAAITSYCERNARGSHGEHRYTAEEYGTSEAEIRDAFADYVERFGL